MGAPCFLVRQLGSAKSVLLQIIDAAAISAVLRATYIESLMVVKISKKNNEWITAVAFCHVIARQAPSVLSYLAFLIPIVYYYSDFLD